MAGGIAISSLDKVLVSRGRPPVLHLETVTSASFPSGHTTETTAFCLALLLTVLAGRPPRILGVLTPLATVATVAGVAMSRIYLGVHYPTDIIGGVVLGGGWTVLVYGLISDTPRSHEPKTHLPKRMSRSPRDNQSLPSIGSEI
jgi:undecaprenyl-diphosphatase